MHIVLIRCNDQAQENTRLPSSLNKVQGVLPPLGLAYIAGVLEKNNINVSVIDCHAENLSNSALKKRLSQIKPDLAGIGPVMTPSIEGVFNCAKLCKEAGLITVLGGPQLSLYPEETLSHDFIDFGINGEVENSFLELVQALEKKSDYSNIAGLVFKKQGKIIVNLPEIVENLDELPLPAYHLLPMDKYSSIIGLGKASTMIASRGCPFNCSFCFKTPSDKQHRTRDPKKVVEEMEFLIEKYKIEEIMFYDDTITVNREYIIALCNEIRKSKHKITWESPTRIDCLDDELLEIMAKSGCARLRMGVESGNDEIRKSIGKNFSKQKALSIFKKCRKLKIETFAYFILGYLGETKETMQETINFAKKLNPDYVMFTVGTPLPGTKFWDDCVNQNLIEKDYWKQTTLGKTQPRIPYIVPDADKWVKKAYLSFYLRPNYILKRLGKLTSFDYIRKSFSGLKAILTLK